MELWAVSAPIGVDSRRQTNPYQGELFRRFCFIVTGPVRPSRAVVRFRNKDVAGRGGQTGDPGGAGIIA